mgnify:CR=1 FL=1
MTFSFRSVVLILGLAVLSACTYNVPSAISTPPPNNPSVNEVRQNSESLIGQRVRWGGTIASVTNKESETWIEIVERELRRSGQPLDSDSSAGRFIARIPGFFDPTIYDRGRQITVVGVIEKPMIKTIGDFAYLFPVVAVDGHQLWELTPETIYIEPSPFWYSPPWHPGYYPYFRPYW